MGRDSQFDIKKEMMVDNYYYIGTKEKYTCDMEPHAEAITIRRLSRENLSETEYILAEHALMLNQRIMSIQMRGMVRHDQSLADKVTPFLKTTNEVLFGILAKEGCTEDELRIYSAQNDF